MNVYYDAVFHGAFSGGFLQAYFGPYFAEGFPFDLSNQGIYLWYLFWLFTFSLATVHLFKWLAKEENRSKLSKLHAPCNRRGGILLLAIPLIIVNIAAVPPFFVFPSAYGGWKLPAYLALFIMAYVMASSPLFEESIEKNRTAALTLGIVTSRSTQSNCGPGPSPELHGSKKSVHIVNGFSDLGWNHAEY